MFYATPIYRHCPPQRLRLASQTGDQTIGEIAGETAEEKAAVSGEVATIGATAIAKAGERGVLNIGTASREPQPHTGPHRRPRGLNNHSSRHHRPSQHHSPPIRPLQSSNHPESAENRHTQEHPPELSSPANRSASGITR